MKIVLGSDGSIELTRGEHITRGQNKSRQVFVEWAEGFSPIDTGQFLADNMVVEMCITRPDGEQSGWLTAVKVDGEIKYLYILQAWDTAVSGQASLQVRWYDITQEEANRVIEVSNEAFFIVDNGKIAQPLNLSSENYNDIVLRFVTPLSAQAFRKYDTNSLPDTVTYEPDGAKTAPALFYNFTHEVVDIVPSVLNQVASYVSEKNTRDGFLLVDKKGSVQTEVFFTNIGKIYIRVFSGSPASEFKDIFEQWHIKSVEQQRSINGLLSLIVDKINYSDIVDNLDSLDDRKTLSAKQGKILKGLIEELKQTNATIKIVLVDVLPTEGEKNVIYLVPNTKNAEQNIKDEYLWINDKWELIGSTAIDLSDYQPKTDNRLDTNSKEIVAAINEVNEKVGQGGGIGSINFTDDGAGNVIITASSGKLNFADDGNGNIILEVI